MNYKPKTLSFFLARIGKTIYRDSQGPCCDSCKKATEEGLTVQGEAHAKYLAIIDADFGAEGIFSNYRDTP